LRAPATTEIKSLGYQPQAFDYFGAFRRDRGSIEPPSSLPDRRADDRGEVPPEERIGAGDIAAEEIVQPCQLRGDRGSVDTERPGPAPGLKSRQSVLQRAPLGLAILDERRGRLTHDPGQDGPLDIPEFLLDLP